MAADHSIAEIAAALGANAWGDVSLRVSGASEPASAKPHEIALALQPAYAETLSAGGARAALIWADADPSVYGLQAAVLAPRPRYSLSKLSAMLDPGPSLSHGIHPTAVIDPSAVVSDGACIGPFVSIGRNAKIGPGARLASHVSIGAGAVLGADALIHERVVVGARVKIGDRVIVQPGAVIGGDGFSFVTAEKSAVEAVRETLGDAGDSRQQAHARIHSLGAVQIGDDVEIGANACIDRGTVSDTEIGSGTKIDNLVQIGHNVRVGRDCLLCGQVGIAGSTLLGDRVVLGGQAGVTDHLNIGDDVIAGAGTMLRTNQPKGRVMLGDPAMPMQQSIEAYKALRRLPRLIKKWSTSRS